MDEGKKDDEGKLQWHLVPPLAMEQVVKVLTDGAKRYGAGNWREVPDLNRRYYDAATRHLATWRRGGVYDKESGDHHLAHAIASLLFILQDNTVYQSRLCAGATDPTFDERKEAKEKAGEAQDPQTAPDGPTPTPVSLPFEAHWNGSSWEKDSGAKPAVHDTLIRDDVVSDDPTRAITTADLDAALAKFAREHLPERPRCTAPLEDQDDGK